MIRRSAGFTLIELIVVVVILSILAAFAVPRFAGFRSDANKAVVNGLAGSLRAAASIAHARQIVDNATTDAAVILDGTTVDMTSAYPDATTTGIVSALQDTSGFTTSTGSNTITFTNITNCTSTYTNSGSGPSVATTTTGC